MPANKKRRQNIQLSGYYIEGSAVRKLDTLPEEYPSKRRRSAEQRELAERKKKRQIARKNQEKALRLDFTYTLFLLFSVVVTVAACVFYLNLQNEITRTNEQIASLKSELSVVSNENTAMEERINGAVDLAEVYQKAVNDFGMTAITEGQIHYYSNENQDYVRQYGQIPTDD